MKTLWQDVLYGCRMLLHKPGFTAVAALSLGLGIGANTLIFSLINATLLRPLNFPAPDKIVAIWSVPLEHPDQRNTLNATSYFAVRDRNTSFESIGGLNGSSRNLGAERDGAPAERINGWTFTPSIFTVIGTKPILGRIFTEEEDQVDNAAPVVLISYRLWQQRFNLSQDVLGKQLTMDKKNYTVIGVLPKDFNFFADDTDYVGPLEIGRTQAQSKQGFFLAVARLKRAVSLKQAQSEMSGLAAQLASSDPDRNKGNGANVQRLQEAAYGNLRQPLLILQGAVAFVLLIGCANVAGLLLARAASRRTEVAVRTALGAGRGRIVRQLITESVPLSLLGGVLGVFLAWGGLKLFVAAAPPNFPRINEVALDARVLAFTALLAVFTGVVFGIAPALQASKPDLVNSLKESGRSGTDSVTRQHLRSALVCLQIALALVLLIGAGLMINSFMKVQKNDVGADPHSVLTFDFRFPQSETIKPYGRYRGLGLWDVSPLPSLEFDQVLERVKGLPGVISAAAISQPPLAGGGLDIPFLIEGRPAPPPSNASGGGPGQGQSAGYFAITPNYFATMKIPILRGRDITAQDNAGAPKVIIVNQTLARRFFPNEDPVGKRMTLDFVPDEQPRQIIGVVGDTVTDRMQRQPRAMMFVPHTQQTPRWMGPAWNQRAGMIYTLRTSVDPMSLASAVKRAVAEVDPNKPASNIRTVEQSLDQQVQYLRLYILLLGIFGGVAVVLAAIGIYGVMAYSVSERTREIGIRMALGAGAGNVLGLVARQALILVGIGLVLGLGASFALTRVISSALWGVSPTDPATYTAISVGLMLVALIASLVPTRRAVQVDPTVALRYE